MIPASIRAAPSWCVSKNKMPLDVYALKRGYEWGASDKRSHSSYTNFEDAIDITKKTGYALTLFVDPASQGLYIIDIEKTCPQEIRQAIFLALHDDIIYLERSMSGKGYHAAVRCDRERLPSAKYKKWFELLAGHHCAFTNNEIAVGDAYFEEFSENEYITDDDRDVRLLESLSAPISAMDFHRLIGSGSQIIKSADDPCFEEYRKAVSGFDGRHADLFGLLCDVEYSKTVDGDFHGDYSSYEFGYASKLHYALRRLAGDMIDAECRHYELPMSKDESIMMVYMVLKQCVAPRDKHKSMRNGLPWLLYTSQQVYVKTFGPV